jgi:hypothetical protein
MDATAAIVSFALLVGVLYLIARPFLAPEEAPVEEAVSPELVSQKNRIINAIREIDMDYETGKLSEEDYKLLRSRYTAAAAEILKRIDTLQEEEAALAEAAVATGAVSESSAEARSLSASTPDSETAAELTEQPLPEGIDEEEAEALSDVELQLEREIAERKAKFKESQDA